MKKALSPAVIAVILGLVVVGLGLFFWKQSGGPGGGGASGGKLKSDLGPMEQDPEKFKKGMDELLANSKKGK